MDRLRGFIEAAPDAFILFDSDLNFIELNDAALEYHPNWKKKDIVGRNITEMVPGIEETDRYKKYLDVIKTGNPIFMEDITPNPEFGNKYVDVRAFKVGNGLGVIVRDITNRKQAEKALIESEAGARTLINASPAFASLMDLDGTIVSINDAGANIFGKNRDDLIGSKASDLLSPEFSYLNESRIAQGKRAVETWLKSQYFVKISRI